MLEEVGQSGAARGFVSAADVVPEVNGHQGPGVVLGDDDAQAVGQGMADQGKVDHAGANQRSNQPSRRLGGMIQLSLRTKRHSRQGLRVTTLDGVGAL